MRRVIFVDDDPELLESQRRMLYPLRNIWEMTFVSDGETALAKMAEEFFDVIVADIRMPGIGGIELLEQIRRLYPQTVRIALSGQVDKGTSMQAAGVVHQFLTKPCDAETLKIAIMRACKLSDFLHDTKLRYVVSQMRSIPVLPDSSHLTVLN